MFHDNLDAQHDKHEHVNKPDIHMHKKDNHIYMMPLLTNRMAICIYIYTLLLPIAAGDSHQR